jgi:hypothetical protein
MARDLAGGSPFPSADISPALAIGWLFADEDRPAEEAVITGAAIDKFSPELLIKIGSHPRLRCPAPHRHPGEGGTVSPRREI